MPIEINGLNSQRTQLSNDRQIRKTGKGSTGSQNAAGATADTDSVTLTDTAARLRTIEKGLAQQPVVDVDRVQAMETSIRNGEYRIEPERVADKIIELEDAMDGQRR
ncbi:MAG TPA: flagellar biosynthesis anti-sigma factor FlgM [Gammaproteobacteria bacterium]|nr:flagellar biosynthesis anti-sigma factor FlgM [Gammaproteobacteria bacterium]